MNRWEISVEFSIQSKRSEKNIEIEQQKNIWQNSRTEYSKNRVSGCCCWGFFFQILERRTNLGLCYRGAFSITQRREGQAEFQLSITLTKIEKEKGREDILKDIPHSSENNFLKVIWFQPPRTPAVFKQNRTRGFLKAPLGGWRHSHLILKGYNTSSILCCCFVLQEVQAGKIDYSAQQHVSGLVM